MLTRDDARLRVVDDLRRLYPDWAGPSELIVDDEHTIERPWGWVFFYTTRGALNGDWQYRLGGNAPYMVNRDGTMRLAGTAWGIEHYIEKYEAELAQRET